MLMLGLKSLHLCFGSKLVETAAAALAALPARCGR